MAPYRIRLYRDEDYDAVRSLFARGIMEHAPAMYRHVLCLTRVQLGLLSLFWAVCAMAGSWLLALAAVVLVLAAMWPVIHSFSKSFVTEALVADLQDIDSYYMRAPDSCFWVVEAGGAVVAMVGAAPTQDLERPGPAMELKRLSVSREHRGHGISRALCGEVLRFARARGYGAVVLYTSTVQLVAQRLYESQGFRKVLERSPSLFSRLICFHLIHYRLQLPSHP
ncbi:N-acetyltransferase 8-like [Coturnix japonica]|uniref:N-acetyltransferase 8-like n=1 Tax=Coturnix japonica TaxID=93934 RepID=UPI0007772C92|nr:N-acetyltransferase 8-like [Coturnix japonica]